MNSSQFFDLEIYQAVLSDNEPEFVDRLRLCIVQTKLILQTKKYLMAYVKTTEKIVLWDLSMLCIKH
jgi:hypothetical protein